MTCSSLCTSVKSTDRKLHIMFTATLLMYSTFSEMQFEGELVSRLQFYETIIEYTQKTNAYTTTFSDLEL